MVNKCVAFGCSSGYDTNSEKVSTFSFLQLINSGFFIRAVVADNHSANVNAFNILLDKFEGDKMHYITLPNPPPKIFLFFDSVHLLKNIRKSLLNKKKFIFPAFTFEISNISVSSKEGSIAWPDSHKVYNKDNALNAKLCKAPKHCILVTINKMLI